jgi:hypothetical protein
MSRETEMATTHMVNSREEMGHPRWAPGTYEMLPPEDFDLAAAYEALFSLSASVMWLIYAVENLERRPEPSHPGPTGT